MTAPATEGTPGPGAPGGSGRWILALLVRMAAFAFTVYLLQWAGSATWDAHLLRVRGEVRPATVVEVDPTGWGKPERAWIAVAGADGTIVTARVTTSRKDLEAGRAVHAVVDPSDPQRAALAGEGWPWRQTVVPLMGLLLVVTYVGKYGRWPLPVPPAPQGDASPTAGHDGHGGPGRRDGAR